MPPPSFAAEGAGILRKKAVDHDLPDRNLPTLEFVQELPGLADDHFFRQHHRHKAAGPVILQQTLQAVSPRRPGPAEIVQFVRLIRTPETLLHEAVLGQQGIQGLKPGADQLRGGQQPQGVAGGRGIHHDEVVGLGFDPRGDFQQGP